MISEEFKRLLPICQNNWFVLLTAMQECWSEGLGNWELPFSFQPIEEITKVGIFFPSLRQVRREGNHNISLQEFVFYSFGLRDKE